MLGPLQANGGLTQTHALMPGSPAIDRGDPAILPGTSTDQRGFERVVDGDAIPGARADMGSYEFGALSNGDFDNDSEWDCDDIDALVQAIIAGTNNPVFDLTGDQLVDYDDIVNATSGWLRISGEINLGPGRTYLVGDATLDGVVDGQDFIAWNSNKFTMTPAWCQGDFNADGLVDGQDFIAWNGNKFMSSDTVQSLGGAVREIADDFAGPPRHMVHDPLIEESEHFKLELGEFQRSIRKLSAADRASQYKHAAQASVSLVPRDKHLSRASVSSAGDKPRGLIQQHCESTTSRAEAGLTIQEASGISQRFVLSPAITISKRSMADDGSQRLHAEQHEASTAELVWAVPWTTCFSRTARFW